MIESLAASVTYLFSDIEGSTRLWEADPVCASLTVAWHDEISRTAVQRHRGRVVKTTGDGLHAVFDDPADAVAAVVELQLALAEPAAGCAPIKVRCGLHVGADQRRDNDFYGQAVNRAARIMSAAHGGQVLLSTVLADRLAGRLPPGVSLRDLGAVRLRDLGSPEHVYQVIHPSLRKDFPPLRSMASTPNNLAQQLNSFVGRDREMDEVRRLLAQNRLLTLLGMGGLGKSRLSVQVAATVLDDYADGVWLVELAALADPLRVPQAVAAVLGVKEEPGGTVLDALIRFVRDRRMLIVLDNCEHVVQSCAELAKRLLEAASGVTILASSRDSLRIAGETIFQVLPLPTPIESKDHAADVLLAIDSVRLFIDRAQAVQPGFRLTDGTARAVAEICRRLDGIPLAIELAAARVRAMTVDQIASRLDDRFKLLSRGDRAVLPRQQTLRALIDWSYDLLVEEERVLFKRLAVFAAGWTLEAAEAVTAGEGLDRESVLDLLCNLVEKSLVVHDVSRGRYRMLETVREYALEKLRDSSDEAVTRERHLAFFVGYVEHALPFLFGPEQAEWLTALDADRENLFCAHRWCDSSVAGSEAAIRLVAVEKYYWLNRGLLSQGYGIARAALERPALQDSPENYCVALTDVGAIGYFIGQYVQARDDLKRGLELARELGNRSRQISVLQLLGLVEFALGKGEAALDYCNEAERLARESRNPREIMSALTAKGQLLRAIGRTEDARDLYSEALNCARALGDEESIAASLLNLAAVAVDCGKPEGACAMLGEVSAITTRIGSRAAGQSLLEVCAGLAMSRGDVGRATAFLEAAETEAATSGLRRDPADEAFILKVKTALHGLVGAGARGERAPAAPRSFEESLDRASHWLASGCPAAHEDSRAAHSAVD